MRHYLRIVRVMLFSVFLLLCNLNQVLATDIFLVWDASISPGITGYRVYYGNVSQTYGAPASVPNQTSCAVTRLAAGTYYFAVTALDTNGYESDFSNPLGDSPALPGQAAKV
jgi:fibronectin type 3 domain-containing protein